MAVEYCLLVYFYHDWIIFLNFRYKISQFSHNNLDCEIGVSEMMVALARFVAGFSRSTGGEFC